jgi:hypothetical protein
MLALILSEIALKKWLHTDTILSLNTLEKVFAEISFGNT